MEDPKLGGNLNIEKKFTNPQEELEYLREQVSKREEELSQNKENVETEQVISDQIKKYSTVVPEEVLEKGTVIPEKIRGEIVLELEPEAHDDKMSELLHLVETKGIINAIDIVSKLENAHISDDFHRFLVQYISAGFSEKGLKEGTPLAKSIKRSLFEVTVPDRGGEESDESLVELVSRMKMFFSGIRGVTSGSSKNDYITIEIAKPVGTKEFAFYFSIPSDKTSLFEKQILSVFPDAKVYEEKNDYNIFNFEGSAAGAYASFSTTAAKPIRLIDEFETDPLNVILNVFTKLKDVEEGAAIQLIFKPVGTFYDKNYAKALKNLEKGESAGNEMGVRNTFSGKFSKGFSGFISKSGEVTEELTKKPDAEGKPKESKEPKDTDTVLVEAVKKKVEEPVVSTNIRIIASSTTPAGASGILSDIESAFHQFQDPAGNSFKFSGIKDRGLKGFFKDFSYRVFSPTYDLPMNLKEVATVFHLPSKTEKSNPQLKKLKSATAPAPIGLPKEGILLGYNEHAGVRSEVKIATEDRLRHFYVIGQTGTGKTTILKDMIKQDIQNGEGVCFIDPHGSDIQDILTSVPQERYEDIIYFDPSYVERPMGLNMLEYDINNPQQKTFVVNELFSIFQKLYGAVPESMGPMFEQYFRNATMLVIEDPETGSTLLDVSRVLADKAYRDLKISRCKNPIVVQFWTEVAEKAGGEAALANIVPYITSKFDVFLANDIMRPVVAQEKSSFNFRDIMDNKKILLVNLSKGKLGDINSNLIGLIVVGKILMAALSRVDDLGKDLPNFYLYIDEFQNVTTDSISTILSEARKYKLGLNIAHQFIAQLEDGIKDSVFGNVGNIASFRVGAEDAEYLESQFKPEFVAKDLMNINNFNCYVKMLANGTPIKPFNIQLAPYQKPDFTHLEELKQLSYLKYGRDREEVDEEIMRKYKKEQ